MFSVRLVARPDPRMVEVPLEIEAELPREFEGAALLSSSGLPRKVKLRAPKDALKLSTAYRTDQLLGEVARVALKASAPEVARIQHAVQAFMKVVRERRQDGAVLLLQTSGSGKFDLVESLPSSAKPAGSPGNSSTLGDRVAALERRLMQLESAFARIAGEVPRATEGAPEVEGRIAALEGRIAALSDAPAAPASLAAQVAFSPAGNFDAPGRSSLRRSTAVDAFSAGMREELSARLRPLLAAAQGLSDRLDRRVALEAEVSPGSAEFERFRAAAAEATARLRALERVRDEVDFYPAGDLPVAATLVDRLSGGAALPDPAEGLAQAVKSWASGEPSAELAARVARAAALAGWTLLEPAAGSPVDPLRHRLAKGEGSTVAATLCPGLMDSAEQLVLQAAVAAGVPPAGEAAPASATPSSSPEDPSTGDSPITDRN